MERIPSFSKWLPPADISEKVDELAMILEDHTKYTIKAPKPIIRSLPPQSIQACLANHARFRKYK